MSKKPIKAHRGHRGKQRKPKTFLKLLSVLITAGLIAGFFLPFFFTIQGKMLDGSILGGEVTLFTLLMNTVNEGFSLELYLNNFTLFSIASATVLITLCTLIALIDKKGGSALFRFICVVAMALLIIYASNQFAAGGEAVDVIMLTAAVATVFMILQAFGGGGKSIIPVLCFLLFGSVVFMSVMFPFFGGEKVFFVEFVDYVSAFDLKGFTINYVTLSYIAFALLFVNLIFTAFQMGFIKSNGFTVFRYLLQLAATVAVAIMAFMDKVAVTDMMYFLIFTGVSFVAFLFTIFASGKKKTKSKARSHAMEAEYEEMDRIASGKGRPYPVYVQAPPANNTTTTSNYYPAPNIYINVADSNAIVEISDKKSTKKTKAKAKEKEVVANPLQPIIIPAPQPVAPVEPAAPLQPIVIDLSNTTM